MREKLVCSHHCSPPWRTIGRLLNGQWRDGTPIDRRVDERGTIFADKHTTPQNQGYRRNGHHKDGLTVADQQV